MPSLRHRPDLPQRFSLPTASDFKELAEHSKRVENLTHRQKAVLARLAHGESNPEIMRTFTISRNTVEREITLILDALGVENRMAASALFLQWSLRNHTETLHSE